MRNRGWLKAQKNETSQHHENGYVLPLVVISGMILILGAVALSTRSFNSLMGAILQSHGHQAEEIADSGADKIIQELNQKYPYLLTVDCEVTNNAIDDQWQAPRCDGWEDFSFDREALATACSNRSENPENIMESLYQPIQEEKGYYRLRNYEFLGDKIQGGTAVIQVQGQRRSGTPEKPKVAASAVIEKEVTIVPKCCNLAPYEECGTTGWNYGLATDHIALKTGDVIDEDPTINSSGANVHCTSCSAPPTDPCVAWSDAGQIIPHNKIQECKNGIDITEDMVGVIDGERTSGSLSIPDAPVWNTEQWGDPEPITIGFDNYKPHLGYYSPTFNHAQNQGPHPSIKGCYTEINGQKKTTHCRIKTIQSSSQSKVKIEPGDGDIRFYIEGQSINLSGDHFIIPEDAEFGQFAIFGGKSTWEPDQAWQKGQKTLNFSGSGQINAFIHMPYFNINFSGGQCWRPLVISGAAITYRWNSTGDCAQIQVPTNASQTICDIYNICANNTMAKNTEMEFTALGTKRWKFIQTGPN